MVLVTSVMFVQCVYAAVAAELGVRCCRTCAFRFISSFFLSLSHGVRLNIVQICSLVNPSEENMLCGAALLDTTSNFAAHLCVVHCTDN